VALATGPNDKEEEETDIIIYQYVCSNANTFGLFNQHSGYYRGLKYVRPN